MTFNLDMKTVFASLVVGHLFTVILISAYRNKHTDDKAANTFYMSKWVQSLAWGLLIFRSLLPDVISISVANSILLTGAALETFSLLMLQVHVGKRLLRLYLAYTLAAIAGFNLIFIVHNVESVRIAYASLATAGFIVYPAYRMITAPKASRLQTTMGYLYMSVVIGLAGRAFTALQMERAMSLFSPSIYQTLSFLSLYLIMILGNTGFILLSKQRADERLLYLANYDDLTGVLNRRGFMEQAEQAIARLTNRQPVTFILFDIDHYKLINDTHGHDIGDKVLKEITHVFDSELKDTGIFGRYGGDEFAILLPGMGEAESDEITKRLRMRLEQAYPLQAAVKYTVSMGVVTVEAEPRTGLDRLYQLSDEVLYEAKRKGRNCVARASVS
ncbi:GGDEF domain-containing protein [Paenibacillus sp. CAA11]|uniref:GGDEF domain-containing protein n=1 Tax=Paenibacillus sp. CAA11 TaxID=1532905 RepID=UPI000D34A48D|nr:GGDEF domain-containing protein [Paenibacillus sp. CAA11]AWB46448.1 GGDEF domain-containing protein [Paenibacillus sp. CAA11]